MEEILFLTHRIPWPPNKGDKIRSHHILRHLARRYRVHLGTFIDDPADEAHLPALHDLCAGVHAARLGPWTTRWRAVNGLARGRALTLPCYADAGLRRWVDGVLAARPVRRAVVFSSAMAQYVEDAADLHRVIDLVDVDSDKWTQYARERRWPWSWLYRREGARLLEYERFLARRAEACALVSDEEVALFRRLAPEAGAAVRAMHNGVDTDYFDPAAAGESPYADGEVPLVFTGAMDYWPNVDAVRWFAEEILPRIRAVHPAVRFYIVGSRPTPAVRALARDPAVTVTGFVDDVRPWLGHARLAVAPLRVARGVQNKVLEAMAMARPVVASPQALAGIRKQTQEAVICAEGAAGFADAVSMLLNRLGGLGGGGDAGAGVPMRGRPAAWMPPVSVQGSIHSVPRMRYPRPGVPSTAKTAQTVHILGSDMGLRARQRVVADYGWSAQLRVLDALLQPSSPEVVEVEEGAAARTAWMEVVHGG